MDALKDLMKNNLNLAKLMAGQIAPEDFFTQKQYLQDKQSYIELFKQSCPNLQAQEAFFGLENIAAAWLVKARYNESMTNEQFEHLIARGQKIFQGDFEKFDFAAQDQQNDLCAMMWGMEALNGIQSYESGATRIRLAEGVSYKIIQAMEDAGAVRRDSTHAVGTRLLSDGLGKDIANENLRQITPRGMGAMLIHPTSADGTISAVIDKKDKMHQCLDQNKNFDLLLKQEDYGYKDSLIHTREHTRILTVLNRNIFSSENKKYEEGKALIFKKSTLALEAESLHGKGRKIHRKEHLSELKEQAKPLVELLTEGKKKSWFPEFGISWNWRIKIPPFEKKIVSSEQDKKYGIGRFLYELLSFKKKHPEDSNLDKLTGLLDQAQSLQEDSFAFCREGNEVLVDCSRSEKANLYAKIGKNSDNSPVLDQQVEAIRTDNLVLVNKENAENGFPTYEVVKERPSNLLKEKLVELRSFTQDDPPNNKGLEEPKDNDNTPKLT